MIHRNKKELEGVQWGNGSSFRLLTEKDGMGFTVCHTVVEAGSESRLQYRRHLEACYCISGKGQVISADGSTIYDIEPGAIYALDENDPHILIADESDDLHLVSVFNPPLTGQEKHQLSADGFSQY
ncbi:ectoine synthase [Vibrio coralliilyticus]|jgi:L-ectoine synthase|uniref:L-ectoine synthase n=1 Tax=Vibrio coralliilyticus TaxID=190893 RepID=A0A0A0SW37_9VIBR|nr:MULTISPECIES: ectoine synthase [Vibrio]AIW20770.1 ectoine synthase [Vibrio coralliilyticus]ANW26818.1 L-ectoine synthase [Vibrio coralliilyticus]ARC94202.1 L-ectoine synthase [Vibrio coralliilyticus]EEX32489.1 putative L-ectoine synthase [Vibrio coralliilyticus ATCC BAA-450]KFI11817.1 ectoine synthase [Vibrio sp. B183]